MFTLGQERFLEESTKPQPIMFTAGAVPVVNDKGEMSMKKVKVKRYVAGKKPEWAPVNELDRDSDEDDDGDRFGDEKIDDETGFDAASNCGRKTNADNIPEEKSVVDRRLQRLMDRSNEVGDVTERLRHRRNFEPEVISEEEESEPEEPKPYQGKVTVVEEESSDDEDLDDDEIERRRMLLRQRVQAKRVQEEELYDQLQRTTVVHVKEEEKGKEESSGDDEDQFVSESEYSDSEEEGPRLKPVFVRKRDRITIQEREQEEEKRRNSEEQIRKMAEERRKYSLKLVEAQARIEVEEENKLKDVVDRLDSDDGNDEEEYEAWKLRELKRIKRDRDEREAVQKSKEETERLRNMTEDERRIEARSNPKVITNQMLKGKYKFMQKYYHRGAFYLDEEDETLKRDITRPTLEDHFDKSVLPKVMQVKNFGRSGRTKYTHLLDQDTTSYESPWNQDNALANKFTNKAGGMKQVFDRPSKKKRTT